MRQISKKALQQILSKTPQRTLSCYISNVSPWLSRYGHYQALDKWRACVTMDEIEFNTQSFIVKIWVEDRAEEAGHRVWRGHITHVSSNKRRSLNNLRGIEDFILPYLKGMGVRLGMRWRMRHWLSRMMR